MAQEGVEQRLERLETQNREMRRRLDELAARPAQDSVRGSEQQQSDAVKIGGYGEMVFSGLAGGTNVADLQRAVVRLGRRFDEHWSFGSELELEHATTEATSGTTTEGGEISLEAAFVEYRWGGNWRARAGLLVMPVGLVNLHHSPTWLLAARRSETDTRIIPTTWSELGGEVRGILGPLTCTGAVVNSLDAEHFDAGGLREGRQGGNRAAAENPAFALRVDWNFDKDLQVGGSVYRGRAGTGNLGLASGIPSLQTTILEAHFDLEPGHWLLRGEYATAFVGEAAAFDAALGRGVGRRLEGLYGEVGCDVLGEFGLAGSQSLVPFLRLEHIDTQRELPAAGVADPAQRDTGFTIGLAWKPVRQIVCKLDYENWGRAPDRLDIGFGYTF
jgi:Phosphate-selective porin O and P